MTSAYNNAMKTDMIGKVQLIQVISEEGCQPMAAITATMDGFPGDRHSGLTRKMKRSEDGLLAGSVVRNTRQLSLVASEEMAEIAAEMSIPGLSPDDLRANLVLSGVPHLTLLPPGTRLRFESGLCLVVKGYNAPCSTAGKRIAARYPEKEGLSAAFVKAGLHRRGVTAWVELAGAVSQGDQVTVHFPKQPPYPGRI